MKRLQVGDECYVRHCETNEIHKCTYWASDVEGIAVAWLCDTSKSIKGLFLGKKYRNRLVYPYPIIKQLAK